MTHAAEACVAAPPTPRPDKRLTLPLRSGSMGPMSAHHPTTTSTAVPPPLLPAPPWPTDVGDHDHHCRVCGRGLSPSALTRCTWVHVVNGGTHLAPVDAPDNAHDPGSDLGWWPVGSECARTIPLTHRRKGLTEPEAQP